MPKITTPKEKSNHMLRFLMIRPPRKHWFDSSSSARALYFIHAKLTKKKGILNLSSREVANQD
jgi:hypothetical protein